jgi:hypothetical protein
MWQLQLFEFLPWGYNMYNYISNRVLRCGSAYHDHAQRADMTLMLLLEH